LKNNNKAQVSLEYMVMLGVSLLIFATIIAYSMNMLGSVQSQLSVDTGYKAVEEIKEAVDFIYVHGHPSKIRRSVTVPAGVENITILDNVVKMQISTGYQLTDIYDVTKGNMTGIEFLAFVCPTEIATGRVVCRQGTYIIDLQSMPLSAEYTVNITAG
jgi:uncharacterized protein (UPF0333 family)